MKKLIFLGMILLSACGPGGVGGPARPPPPVYETHSMDGVKNIRVEIDDPLEASTYNQHAYRVSPGSRVLIRFETLKNYIGKIMGNGSRIWLKIMLTGGQAGTMQSHLRLCAVIKNWMMLSTWKRAHPFNKQGNWDHAGGDFDESQCLAADLADPTLIPPPSPSPDPSASPAPSPSPQPVVDTGALYFNLNQWFTDYPQGRQLNYGLILISDQPVQINGDASESNSPRLFWQIKP